MIKTVEWTNEGVRMLDQRLLPNEEKYLTLRSYEEVADAIKKMQVPPGFHVELVAAEPDLVNPVAMTFDEKGRIWITESIEYPRRLPRSRELHPFSSPHVRL